MQSVKLTDKMNLAGRTQKYNLLKDGLIQIEHGASKQIRFEDFVTRASVIQRQNTFNTGITDVNCNVRYWKNLYKIIDNKQYQEEFAPIYAKDQEFSLFNPIVETWNLNNLTPEDSLIHDYDCFPIMPGINTSYSYIAMDGTSFATHIENSNLYSINYMHRIENFDGLKKWNVVSKTYKNVLESTLKSVCQEMCNSPLRHKNIIVTPKILEMHKIPYSTVS